ncbi:MAG: hypothetical protein NTY23_15095 [Chloroflexi bacterium]|nr:hypothetical protein [Chloroflexota bacterium]
MAFFTRATVRRAFGSLIAAVPLVPLVMMVDALAGRLGWWRYPSVPIGNTPLAWYIAAALAYGAAVGLIGWRVLRQFGGASLVVFVVLVGLVGVIRDYAYSTTTGLIKFGGGALPLWADFLSYACAAALVQLLMLWIVGTPRSDRLAREH